MSYTTAEYPALIYKSGKSNVYIANCIVKKLIGYGHTEKDAISNLESVLSQSHADYAVKIKPVYQFLTQLVSG